MQKAKENKGFSQMTNASKQQTMAKSTLVAAKEYLQHGCHIGTRFLQNSMKKFVFKVRPDSLKIIDVAKIDERLSLAANMLANYDSKEILLATRKEYAYKGLKKFAELINAECITGRFIPGTLTNPESKHYKEAKIVFVVDPSLDRQAISEAEKVRIPVIALCNTDNNAKGVDLIVPINNNGRQSIALALMLLAREVMKKKGLIKNDKEFPANFKDFEYVLQQEESK